MRKPALLLAIALAAACGGKKPVNLCSGISGKCVPFKAGTSEQDIQTALVSADAGTTFVFDKGTFAFTNAVTLAADGLTLKGQGMDATVLDFKGQLAGGISVSVTGNAFLMEDIGVRDGQKDGVKVEGSTGVHFDHVKATWTAADPATHGAYGIYPVQSHQVLVENSYVSGASDTGIYVGQSEDIVVRNNEATGNVAGIEIENCHRADVYGNDSHDNAGGILVFTLPGLQQLDGNHVRVYDNKIVNNNTKNFAPAGNIVGQVPRGTGVLVMADRDVEVFHNDIENSKTVSLAAVSFLVTQISYNDPSYYPYPSSVYFHDNTIVGGGDAPDPANSLATLLAATVQAKGWSKVPDVIYDGILDPSSTGTPPDTMSICVGTATTSWVNLHADTIGQGGFPNADTTVTGYDCTLPALPPVSFPGL